MRRRASNNNVYFSWNMARRVGVVSACVDIGQSPLTYLFYLPIMLRWFKQSDAVTAKRKASKHSVTVWLTNRKSFGQQCNVNARTIECLNHRWTQHTVSMSSTISPIVTLVHICQELKELNKQRYLELMQRTRCLLLLM